MKFFTLATIIVLISLGLTAQEEGTTYQPVVSQSSYFDISEPLIEVDIPPRGGRFHHMHKLDPSIPKLNHETHFNNLENALPKGADPAWQQTHGSRIVTQPIQNFEGVSNTDNGGYFDYIAPPDTDGDVGPNHYFHMANTIFEIYDKQGNSLMGPSDNSTIWDDFIGDWTGTNDGDPIVLYDEQADRWLVSQFAVDTDVTGGSYWVLVAISTTSDPTGSYYRYAFEYDEYPDYPKFGVWRDGYYLMVQHGNGTATASVLNRSQMLAGTSPAQRVSYSIPNLPGSGFTSVLPADNDGDWAPAGTPNYFVYFSDDAWGDDPVDRLKIWEFDVNWTWTFLSSLTLVQNLDTDAFSSAFGGHNEGIIPQPGTSRKLAVVEKALMYRLQYRNFGSYESMVCCHTVDVNGSNRAGIRWYELRKTTGDWYIYQQGTYAPGSTDNYWMASIAQNGSGDIALGYSVSSSSTYPSIRYTGRMLGDPLGEMTMGEGVIVNGTDSQEGTSRWGDYTMMSVDPSDDETFWYANEYNDDYTTWGNWVTQIASFQITDLCSASGGCDEHISLVEIGSDISNASACDGYANYTNLSANLPINSSLDVSVTNGVTSWSQDQCGIWVDWNEDDDFDDANETISVSGTPGVGPYTATLTVPESISQGEKIMRISIVYNETPDPCGTSTYGEVEDYTINVGPAVPNVWTGAFNRYWHNVNNWSLGHIPTAADPVEIPDVGWQPVTVDDYPAIANESCKSLLLESGAGLTFYDQELVVEENALVYGDVVMDQENAVFTILGNLIWYSGSSLEVNHNSSFINVFGNWEAKSGSNLNPQLGFVDFKGSTHGYIRNYDADNTFYNLRIYKYDGAELGLSALSTEPLHVENLIFVTTGAFFNSYTSENVILEGAFNFYGFFDMTGNSNTSTFIFDGSYSGLNNYSSGSGLFNNMEFSASAQATAYCDFQAAGDISITQGVFHANGHTVSLAGNWTNSTGPDGFVETDSRVIFNGPGHQYVYGDEHFNILEVNNGAALRVNNSNYDVSCNTYDWTSGGIDIVAGNFTANDLTDSGLFGTWWCNPNGTITVTQDNSQYVDLNGEIHIYGGTMTVNGGSGSSWWPYVSNAVIEMTDGTLDFVDVPIRVSNNAFTLTENITGGTIKCQNSFWDYRGGFTPEGGTLELYGPNDAQISMLEESNLYNLIINKQAVDQTPQPEKEFLDLRDGTKIPNTRANTTTALSNFTVTNDLTIENGTFDLNGFQVSVGDDVDIFGNLTMNDPADDLSAGFIKWQAGSQDNVTSGTFHADNWQFLEGTNAKLGTGNTAFIKSMYFPEDDDAEFGNLVAVPFGSLLSKPESRAYYPTRVSGDFTIQNGTSWFFSFYSNTDLLVNGNAVIENGASLEIGVSNEFAVGGTLNLNGTLNLLDGSTAQIQGELFFPSTGWLNISNSTFTNGYNAIYYFTELDGRLTMNENAICAFPSRNIQIGTSFIEEISGGTLKFGRTFVASASNTFEPSAGTVEFTQSNSGHYVQVTSGNFLHNLTVNKPGSSITVHETLEIINDVLIENGNLNSNNKTIFVGGDWTNNNGALGFSETESTVWFYGETYSHINTNETFYNLYIFDFLTDKSPVKGGKIVEETYIEDGVNVNVLNDCYFLGGSLNMGANTTLDVNGNIIFNGGQLIVPDGTVADVVAGAHYENNNPGQAFFPGASTITFDGIADQNVTSSASTVYFNNLHIDNPGNLVRFDVNTHIYGDVNVMDGTFVNLGLTNTNTFEGDINVAPSGGFLPKGVINFEGAENTVFNDQSTITSYLWGDVFIDKSTDDLQVLLQGNMLILNGYSIDVLTGTVDLNGNILRCTENVTIHDGGKIIADAGATIETGDGNDLTVQNGGVIEIIGETAFPATIKAWNGHIGHRFRFTVETGGFISASNASFEYLEGGFGVYVMEGATVDPANSFDYCEFRYGESVGLSTFLTINNNQVLNITGASFPDADCDYNVGKDLNQGHITFVDFSGDFAGEDFDLDDFNLIDWYVPTLEANPLVLEVGSNAGFADFDVTSNLNWTASESTGWFSIAPSFGSGDALVSVTFDENISVVPRSGEITLSAPDVPDVTVTVNQAGADYFISIDPLSKTVSNSAGTTTFSVEANPGWTWTVTETADWFSVSPMSGTGNATLTVTYDENPDLSSRQSSINLPGGVSALLKQAGADKYLTVSPANQDVGPEPGSTTFNVSSNILWNVGTTADWLTVSPASGSNDGLFDVDYEENATGSSRIAEITVTEDGGGLSQTVTLTQASYPMHSITLPAGWSGLSSYLQPADNNLDVVFSPILANLVIAQTLSGIYYPAGPVNTIGAWGAQSAYGVKMDASATLTLVGPEEMNKSVFLPAGWSMLPVIVNQPVAAASLLAGIDFAIVKSLAGMGVYWPAMNINTLVTLQPGLAYYILMNSAGSVVFPANTDGAQAFEVLPQKLPVNPWSEIHTTASSHLIAIEDDALSGITIGDVVGVFNSAGNCFGIGKVSTLQQNNVLTVFADDPYTESVDGFSVGEEMAFKIYRPATGEEFDVIATFDPEQPNTGLFSEHGISVLTGLKVSPTGTGNALADAIGLYPNPTDGKVKVTGIEGFNKMEIYNATGKMERVVNIDFSDELNLNMSDLPAGVYQLRFTGNQNTVIKKLIRR